MARRALDSGSVTIAIDALSARLGGGITVARKLSSTLARLRPDWTFVYLYSLPDSCPAAAPPNLLPVYRPRLGRVLSRIAWEQLCLPPLLRRWNAHAVLQLAGFTTFLSRVPQIAVWQNPNIFSVSPPGEQPRSLQLYILAQRLAQTAAMRKAAQNIFLTRHSAKAAGRVWNLERLTHTVIHSGIDADLRPMSELGFDESASRPYHLILAIGHTYFHKNYETLIDAISHLREIFCGRFRLEIIGGAYDLEYQEALHRRIERLQLNELVGFSGTLPSAEVIDRLRTASVYVTTSTLETFGLTTLEAMSQGVPVVASHASCIPEVCGHAALYCDPHNPIDVATAIRRFLVDSRLRQEFRQKGIERVRQFSWEATASRYLAELEAVIKPE